MGPVFKSGGAPARNMQTLSSNILEEALPSHTTSGLSTASTRSRSNWQPSSHISGTYQIEDTHTQSGLSVYVASDGGIGAMTDHIDEEGGHEHEPFLVWPPPLTPTGFPVWILLLPMVIVKIVLHLTIPDCTSLRWQGCLKLALCICVVNSILWIGVFVFLMTEWASKAGDLLNVSRAAVGLTFLALGTSLPDCM